MYLSFIFIFYVTSKSRFNYEIINALEKIYVLLLSICIYTFLAQLFNFFEPTRNRPGTGILGFDAQVNFWISGSHRMVGTFREPVFLVSLLFPVFLALHFKKVQPNYHNAISLLIFNSPVNLLSRCVRIKSRYPIKYIIILMPSLTN